MPTAATTVASSSKREDEDNDDDSDDGVTERAFREVCFCSSLLRLLPLFILLLLLLLRVLFVVSKNRRFFSFHLDLDFFFLSSLRMARFWDI
jgi:hypothetical protein